MQGCGLGVEANLPLGDDSIHAVVEFDLYGVAAMMAKPLSGYVAPTVSGNLFSPGVVFLRNLKIR